MHTYRAYAILEGCSSIWKPT